MKRITVEIKDDEKFIGYYTIDENGLNEYHPCKEVSASEVESEETCDLYDECNKECPLYLFCHQQAESEG